MKICITILLIVSNIIWTLNGQIINVGFEEWEIEGSHLIPTGWQLEDYFCITSDFYVERDSNSFEGQFSLKIRGVCDFWEGGYEPAIISQEVGVVDGEIPDGFSFWIKILNIEEDNASTAGCGWIEVRSHYAEGGADINFWHKRVKEEISEWTKIEVPLTNIDTSKTIDRFTIRISGGSCGNGIGYEGNSDFLVDGVGEILTSLTDLEDVDIKIYPNPTNNFITVIGNRDYILDVFTSLGTLIITVNYTPNLAQSINLSDVDDGVLIIRFTDKLNGNQVIKRIIKHGD